MKSARNDLDLDILHEWNIEYNMGRFDNGVHGMSTPLASLVSSEDLLPSMPSAYIRVLRMFDFAGAVDDTAHPGPFISSNWRRLIKSLTDAGQFRGGINKQPCLSVAGV